MPQYLLELGVWPLEALLQMATPLVLSRLVVIRLLYQSVEYAIGIYFRCSVSWYWVLVHFAVIPPVAIIRM